MATGDFFPFFLLHPDDALRELPFAWNQLFNAGGEASSYLTYAPFVVFSWALQSLGAPAWFAQHLLYVLLRLGAGIGAFLFLRTIFGRQATASALAGTVFYMFNMYVLTIVPNQIALSALALLPLMSWLYLRALQSEHAGRNMAALAMLSTLSSVAFWNPPIFVVMVGGVLLSVLYGLIAHGRRLRTLRLTLMAGALSALINAWWLVPMALTLFGSNAAAVVTPTDPDAWNWVYSRSTLLNAIQMNTVWTWSYPEYFPYATRYTALPLALAVWLGPALALSALLFKKGRRHAAVLIYGVAAILLIFLSKGPRAPLASINLFLYNHVPGFWLFREPAAKFDIPLSLAYSVLIAFTMQQAVALLRRIRAVGATLAYGSCLIMTVVFVVAPHPLITGEVLPHNRPVLPSSRIQVPGYWHEMSRYLNQQPGDGRVVLLPSNSYYAVRYSWGFYGSDELASELIERPVIRLDMHNFAYLGGRYSSSQLNNVVSSALNDRDPALAGLLRLLGVKYVLQRNDVQVELRNGMALSPGAVKEALSSQPDIKLEKSIGSLDLYRVEQALPRVYAPESVAFVPDGDLSDVPTVLKSTEQALDTVLVPGPDVDRKLALKAADEIRLVPALDSQGQSGGAGGVGSVQVPVAGNYDFLYRRPATTQRQVWIKQLAPDRVQVHMLDALSRFTVGGHVLETASPIVLAEFSHNLRAGREYALEIDGTRWLFKPQREASQPLLLGTVSLTPGQHETRLYEVGDGRGPALQNGSFEEGPWGDSIDPNATDASSKQDVAVLAAQADDATHGRRSLLLGAREHASTVSKPVRYFDPNAQYLLSFDYRHLSGAAPMFMVWQAGTGIAEPSVVLPASENWAHHEVVFSPKQDATGMLLYFYSNGTGEGWTANQYDNVRLEKYRLIATQKFSTTADRSWQMIGTHRLSDGEHLVEVDSPATRFKQLIPDPSFEKGLWSEAIDAHKYDHRTLEEVGIAADRSPDASNGAFALKLRAKDHAAATYVQIQNFEPEATYRLSFDYKHIAGAPARFAVWREGVAVADPGETLPSRPGWTHYTTLIQPAKDTSGLQLFFYADGNGSGETINLYDNVRLEKVVDHGMLVLRLQRPVQPQPPEVQYRRISPTHYEVNVRQAKAAHLLVLSESFHPGWKATLRPVAPRQQSLPMSHLVANGYANGWWIEAKGDYQLTLEYQPQRYVFAAMALSACVACLCLVYLALGGSILGQKNATP